MSYRDFVLRVLTVALVGVMVLGAWHLRQIILLVFLAIINAIALNIPVKFLQRLGLNRGLAIALTMFGALYLIMALSAGVVPETVTQLRALVDDLPDALETTVNDYEAWRQDSDTFRDILPEVDYEQIKSDITGGDTSTDDSGDGDADPLDVGAISQFLLPLLGNVGNFIAATIANLLILFFVTLFFLVDPMDYLRGGVMLVPEARRNRLLEVLSELHAAIVAWLLSIGIAMLVTSVAIYVGMGLLLGIPNAAGIAIIAAATTIIPNVGSVIPFIPITIFALADDPAKLLIAIPMYIMIQQLEANVITPQVVKRQLSIPAAMTMIFQLISAGLFGFLGVLLAVPILAVVVTLVRELYVYDVLGMRGVELHLQQDTEGQLYASDVRPPDAALKTPLYVKIRLRLEPVVDRLRGTNR